MHPALNIMVKASRRASQIINRASQDISRLKIAVKQQNDFVTEVDRTAEAAIINILREAYPEYGILAEESSPHVTQTNEKSEYQWIIDPLDGTTNFIHGFPQYAVSIALAYRGQLQQAVVYDVIHNEMFTASKGGGAFLNDRRIRVSGRTRLDESLLGTGFPFRTFENIETFLKLFKEFTQRTSGIRRTGSAALDLAYVASGRLDGFWEFGLMPWDMAAGCLLITEAGGLIGDLSGGEEYLNTGNLVAGSPKVFSQILQVIDPFRSSGLSA